MSPRFFCYNTVISMYCNLQYLLLTNPKLDKFGKSKPRASLFDMQ